MLLDPGVLAAALGVVAPAVALVLRLVMVAVVAVVAPKPVSGMQPEALVQQEVHRSHPGPQGAGTPHRQAQPPRA